MVLNDVFNYQDIDFEQKREHLSAISELKMIPSALWQATINSFAASSLPVENKNSRKKGLEHAKKALSFFEQMGNRLAQANMLYSIGLALHLERRLDDALVHYEQALSLFEQEEVLLGQANTLYTIGDVLFNLNDPNNALACYERARSLAEQVGNPLVQVNALHAIGDTLFFLDNQNEALAYYQRGLSLAEQAGRLSLQGKMLHAIGFALSSQDNPDEALACCKRALSLYEQIDSPLGQAKTLHTIGDMFFFLGNANEALSSYQRVLSLAEQEGYREVLAYTHHSLGRLWRAEGELNKAVEAYQKVLAQVETMRGLQWRDTSRQSQSIEYADVYQEMVALCLEMGHTDKAWHWAERNKGRSLLDLLGSARPRLETPEKRATYDEWLRLEQKVFELEQQLQWSNEPSSSLGQQSQEELEQWRKELKKTQQEEAHQREKVLRELSEGRELIQVDVEPASELADSLRHLVQSNETRRPLLIEYFFLDHQRYVVFLLPLWQVDGTQPMRPIVHEIKLSEETLYQPFVHFLQALSAAEAMGENKITVETTTSSGVEHANARQTALSLFATLPEEVGQVFLQPWWDDALSKMGLMTQEARASLELIIVPNRILHLLPLHAANLDGQPLIEQYPLVYLPNAAIARTLVKRRQAGHNPSKRLIMGPPGKAVMKDGKVVEENGQPLFTADPPEALDETEELAFNLGLEETQQPYALSQMKIDVLKKHARQLRLLHLATHASFNLEDYLQSYILFHQERLTLMQIISDDTLDLHGLRLCYLSSCESGLSHINIADELSGLVWGLTYAGAEAVMASLWPVDDDAGYRMMQRFYDYWIEEGYTLMQAYTCAMRDMRNDCDEEEQENPYFWAPFVLFGNGWLLS